ncbi:gephyrin-like molybdotransferase Glp [Marinomonas balearica]|uniref:Molybdopterin molybdenumtransferase n=1 Tax=Marinomonas balearica TaxID=491947 RepID=A0A4R6M536_9GAMM|nr:gephyrin-like molybdotransferase Glp [Marinomonas balearica]TDO96423.1 molybdopterin molybdochelatase [Marinomonas balearica]
MSPKMMPFQEALSFFQTCLPILVEQESVPVTSALERILAEDIVSEIDVPPAANSAMDGYALNAQEIGQNTDITEMAFHVSQRIPAGQAPAPLQQGTVARIFTGAEIPVGADTVIMQEEVDVNTDSSVTIKKRPKVGENIRPKGQDIAQQQTVLRAGQKLSAMQIGLLASVGKERVSVFKSLKVGVLTTGDELVAPGKPLSPGQIYNSNGPMLASLLSQSGHQVVKTLHCLDSKEETENALKTLSEHVDIIISSGGVSVGEEDYVKEAIENNGSVSLWKVAMKPGKPIVVANVFDTPFIGLPGNPSSTLVTYHWLASGALRGASGQTAYIPRPTPIKTNFTRSNAIRRDEFLRVSILNGRAEPHIRQSSGALLPACESDGYLHIPAGVSINQEDTYDFYPFLAF